MSSALTVLIGQYSDAGRKPINQDFHGMAIPREPQLSAKGIAVAMADGISSSDVSQVASQAAVTSFLEDYYCTSEAWSVKTSVERVLAAANSWLHAQTQISAHRHDKDRGYVCTFSGLVIKSTTAHVFHAGDTRVYHLRGQSLDQLTTDHRVWGASDHSYLSRALGAHPQLEIDYQTLQLEPADLFLIATDGVHEHVDTRFIVAAISNGGEDLDAVARVIGEEAFRRGSPDNITLQLVRIATLPTPDANELVQQLTQLLLPPVLEARMRFDGYTIIREVRGSSRSHIYLATDDQTNERVMIKTPSIDLHADPVYLERFMMEDWIARRINHANVLKPCQHDRKRHALYVVTEFIEGQTLAQWMIDNPRPDMSTVRGIIEQIARGLRAFHRLEMLHQDLKPDNIMIDLAGTVKIIDFGATKVAGILEMAPPVDEHAIAGAAQYAAPEYFLGEQGSSRSDLFSLAVITYQMLTGRLPYGTQIPKSRTKAAQRKLIYQSALQDDRELPAWIDDALKKALHPDPYKRYAEISEFVFDLHQPNQAFLNKTRQPMIERHPVLFWKCLSLLLAIALFALLALQSIKKM